ncbi:unnamed protein product [Rotaria sordida]|uniref:Uncharacterized protein n=1 Tax=Rotaria sordida TaxID=392033 RepID=A0A820CZX2_9BILA|nr:unnamed protein product [Rotaria sordida]
MPHNLTSPPNTKSQPNMRSPPNMKSPPSVRSQVEIESPFGIESPLDIKSPSARSTTKFYYRFDAVYLDIEFLKICRAKDIIPSFLWFKTANNDLSSSPVYKACQRKLLNLEIDTKRKKLNDLKIMYESSLNHLRELSSTDFFEHLFEIIISECSYLTDKKRRTLN